MHFILSMAHSRPFPLPLDPHRRPSLFLDVLAILLIVLPLLLVELVARVLRV